MKIKVKKLSDNCILPKKATLGAAGHDVYIPKHIENSWIYPGETAKIELDFAMAIPEGHYMQLVPRSSLHKMGFLIPNSPGIIDSDYRGPAAVLLYNHTDEVKTINSGQRVAQMILCPFKDFEWEEVEELSKTERGEGGFGSTGG